MQPGFDALLHGWGPAGNNRWQYVHLLTQQFKRTAAATTDGSSIGTLLPEIFCRRWLMLRVTRQSQARFAVPADVACRNEVLFKRQRVSLAFGKF